MEYMLAEEQQQSDAFSLPAHPITHESEEMELGGLVGGRIAVE